jgi:hypothetical protein
MAKRKAARRKVAATRRGPLRARSAAKKTAARKKAAKKSARPRPAKALRRSSKKSARPRARVVAKKTTRKAARPAARKAVKRARPAKAVARRGPRIAKKRAPARTPAPRPTPVAARAVAAARPAAPPKPKVLRPPARTAPGLNRERRTIQDDDVVPSPPSSLDLDRTASAVRSGRKEMKDRLAEHNETSPALTGGDVDADWEGAYSSGDEAPGGDNPTPDQDLVDDIGRAVGVEYQDNEELKGEAKIAKRDRNRWELDPASSDDWDER